MAHTRRKIDLCGYGPFHSLLVILSLAATVLTWFISLDCRLFQITEVSQFDTTETQRYVGIWLNEENGSCQSYHQRDETRIDGFMVLVRTASLIGMFFSLIFWFATIVPCFTNIGGTPYMRQIAHFHVIMAVASACMLVSRVSDICTAGESCEYGRTFWLGVITTGTWLGCALLALFLRYREPEKSRPISRRPHSRMVDEDTDNEGDNGDVGMMEIELGGDE